MKCEVLFFLFTYISGLDTTFLANLIAFLVEKVLSDTFIGEDRVYHL